MRFGVDPRAEHLIAHINMNKKQERGVQKGMECWILDARLRHVLDKHVAARCQMLRYTMSCVCREWRKRWRDPAFLRVAAIVSGYTTLSLQDELYIKERAVRWIYPELRELDAQHLWLSCAGYQFSTQERVISLYPSYDPTKVLESGAVRSTSLCECGIGARCDLHLGRFWYWYLNSNTDPAPCVVVLSLVK